jgi:hypothetical protein
MMNDGGWVLNNQYVLVLELIYNAWPGRFSLPNLHLSFGPKRKKKKKKKL